MAGERAGAPAPGTTIEIIAPLQGTVVRVELDAGVSAPMDAAVVVIESMKMEHVVRMPAAGRLRSLEVAAGDLVAPGAVLAALEVGPDPSARRAGGPSADPAGLRRDIEELFDRRRLLLDEARPDAVEARHRRGHRTARENVHDLCDEGSFVEYGGFAIAAQRARRPVEELIERTPADGLVAGVGRVNGEIVRAERASCAVLSYDYTVLAGTQGQLNHRKKDRMFDVVERLRLPVVFFAEGGGGRPGDTDFAVVTGLDTMAFALFARLSGWVPLVGIAAGWCFAGNAALLGCCDVIIATRDASIGMGGPAMIEGGGLGAYRPEEVGPIDVQEPNGVVDLVAEDDAEAVRLAKRYLAYFQGPTKDWTCPDQRLLRSIVPEQRQQLYDMRELVSLLADEGSVLELRRAFATGMLTALARIEGRTLGIVANVPAHLGGAIDRDGADKAARFLQLCDAHDVPVLFLCDTPGFMVGPEAERTAQVRHFSRLFVTGAGLTVPFFTIVVRKGYGLGAQSMAGGSFRCPLFTVAWPTGELGAMGIEGAVRLGFRRELEEAEDPEVREALFASMVERVAERGRALNVATLFEIDDVVDPADSRRLIVEALRAVPEPRPAPGKGRRFVDTW